MESIHFYQAQGERYVIRNEIPLVILNYCYGPEPYGKISGNADRQQVLEDFFRQRKGRRDSVVSAK